MPSELKSVVGSQKASVNIRGGVTLNPMTKPARKPETMIMEAVYRFHPMFAGEEFPIWLGGAGQDWGRAHVEGGDVQPIGNGADSTLIRPPKMLQEGENGLRLGLGSAEARLLDRLEQDL